MKRNITNKRDRCVFSDNSPEQGIQVVAKDKEVKLMLWYCSYKWHAHTTREQIAQRILEQHKSGGNRRPESLKAWYNLAGGGAGFLLVETDDPRKVTAFLQPYMDLMSCDVHVAYELNYDQQVQELQQVAKAK